MTDFSIKNIRIWLGGSFDPVHLGHLAIIEHIATVFDKYFTSHHLKNSTITLSLLPTAHNPLKPQPTQNSHRLRMLELGLKNFDNAIFKTSVQFQFQFQIDTTEIYQSKTVFTFNTFSHFREKHPDDSLIFVLGMDSILAFDNWYRAYELPRLCHLWVMPRVTEIVGNDGKIVENLPKVFQPFLTDNLQDLILATHGRIYLDRFKVMSVSSSHIRAILKDNAILPSDKKLLLQSYLNPSVLNYILENDLYH